MDSDVLPASEGSYGASFSHHVGHSLMFFDVLTSCDPALLGLKLIFATRLVKFLLPL